MKDTIPSSLGLIDNHCKLLVEHLRKGWTTRTSRTELECKIKGYTLYHNYYRKYRRTLKCPAQLHLSRSQYWGNSHLMNLVDYSTGITSAPMEEFQSNVRMARHMNDADRNFRKSMEQGARATENRHGSLKQDSKFLSQYPRFGLVLVKAPRKVKLSEPPQWAGPALILARQVTGRNLFLMHLSSGIILKKSYRHVRPYLHQSYYNLPLEIRESLQKAYPLCLEHGVQDPNLIYPPTNPTGGIQNNFDFHRTNFSGVLQNILTAFSYIRDSLPKCTPADPSIYFLDNPNSQVPTKEVTMMTPDLPTDRDDQQRMFPPRGKRTISKPLRFRD